ncbi:MAG TPA: hypothetical protein VK653_06515 [Xanthobacteraceae bacterium]|nr:hypothetical protein [Xanthobacteraceae bacterium]
MFEKSYVLKLGPRDWLVLFTIVIVGIAAIAMKQTNRPKDDVTGTVSQTEPPIKHDGTPAHPYPETSQCPPRSDLVFWPNGSSVPSIPPGTSVCFVGDQSFENSGPDRLEVRDR